MVFNCQDRQGSGCGSWRFFIFATKDSSRATEVSYSCRGIVKFKRLKPEPFWRTKPNQRPEHSACEGSSGICSCPGLALKFPEGNKTSSSLNRNCCLTLSFQLFTPKATEKSICEHEDLCPQSLTHFVAVSKHTENYPWPEGSRTCCLLFGKHLYLFQMEPGPGSGARGCEISL